MHTELELTQDGSHTLFVPVLNEHYHSTNGAIQEARHVFINAGLKEKPNDGLKILEIGFGTGLNALLTLLEAEKHKKQIFYTTIELYPLPLDKINKLNYNEVLNDTYENYFSNLHTAAWEVPVKITNCFTLLKKQLDFSKPDNFSVDETCDLIYFDAFAPDKQPQMWTQDIFDSLFKLSSLDAVLTTYCAKGVVRRGLMAAGFHVERLPGPPGKREILRARKVHL